MKTLLERIGRLVDATGPGHAAAIIALIWLLSMTAVWFAARWSA